MQRRFEVVCPVASIRVLEQVQDRRVVEASREHVCRVKSIGGAVFVRNSDHQGSRLQACRDPAGLSSSTRTEGAGTPSRSMARV